MLWARARAFHAARASVKGYQRKCVMISEEFIMVRVSNAWRGTGLMK